MQHGGVSNSFSVKCFCSDPPQPPIGPLSSEVHPLIAFTPVRGGVSAKVTVTKIPFGERIEEKRHKRQKRSRYELKQFRKCSGNKKIALRCTGARMFVNGSDEHLSKKHVGSVLM